MSEIKIDLTLKIIKYSIFFVFFFMLLFTIIKLLPTLRLSRQKTFFSSHFASILSCPAKVWSAAAVDISFIAYESAVFTNCICS